MPVGAILGRMLAEAYYLGVGLTCTIGCCLLAALIFLSALAVYKGIQKNKLLVVYVKKTAPNTSKKTII
jgi:hypothetical protein